MNQAKHNAHVKAMLSKDGQYGSRWYVIYSRPHKEHIAAENLDRQGFPVYYPLATTDERAKTKIRVKALFPRYLFVFLEPGKDDWGKVKSTIGVSKIVMFGAEYGIISQGEIDKFKRLEQKNGIINIGLEYKSGDEVIITTGSFEDNIGIILERISRNRLIVGVDILGKICPVEFEAREIEPKE